MYKIFITLCRRRVLGDSRGGEGDASAGSDNIWGGSWGVLGYLCGIFGDIFEGCIWWGTGRKFVMLTQKKEIC